MSKFSLIFVTLSFYLILPLNIISQNSKIDSLKKVLENHPQKDSTRVNLLNELAYEIFPSNIIQTKQLTLKAKNIAQNLNYKKGIGISYFNLGVYFHNIGNYDSAIICGNKSINFFTNSKYISHKAKSLNLVGISYQRKGDLVKAINFYFDALNLCSENNLNYPTNKIYNNIGNIYTLLKRYNQALNYYFKSLNINENSNFFFDLGDSYLTIGICYFHLDNITEAKKYLQKSIDLNKSIKNFYSLGTTYQYYGLLLDNIKKFEQAEEYHLQGIEIIKKYGNKSMLSFSYAYLASHYLELGNYISAKSTAEKSLKLATEINDLEVKDLAYSVLYEIYNKESNLPQTFKYLTLLKNNTDSLNKETSLHRIAIFNAEFEFKLQKEKTELAHKTALLKQKNAKRIFMGSSIFIAIIVILVSINLYQRIKRNRNLRKANETRDKMMRLIAHDFRSPLISISSTVQSIPLFLEEDDLTSIHKMCDSVEGSVTRVLTLIDNLINWTLSQNDSIPYNPDNYNLKDICEDITEIYKPVAKFKKISLVNQIITDSKIYADTNILKTILRNLINNAIKFTPENGEIILSAKQLQGKIEICVKDNGIGIQEDKLKNIFNVEKDKGVGTKGEKGNGLGLFFCKEFALKNKGDIWVESEPDKGSSFYFTVPSVNYQ